MNRADLQGIKRENKLRRWKEDLCSGFDFVTNYFAVLMLILCMATAAMFLTKPGVQESIKDAIYKAYVRS